MTPKSSRRGGFSITYWGAPRPSGWLHAPNYSIHGSGEGVRPTFAETEAALRGYIAGESQLAIGGRADYELDFLVCLVSCLMAWYGWPDSREVERFVLCGETPHVLFMTASFVPSERFPGRLGRIAVEVNQATSPAEPLTLLQRPQTLAREAPGRYPDVFAPAASRPATLPFTWPAITTGVAGRR